jgi:hypothetical protein
MLLFSRPADGEPAFPNKKWYWIMAALVLLTGVYLRFDLMAFRVRTLGADEVSHVKAVANLKSGLQEIPRITQRFTSGTDLGKDVPPVRFLYPWTSFLIHSLTGLDAYQSLRLVASTMSILIFLTVFIFSYRWFGKFEALLLAILMSAAPTQLYLAQYALSDGFFAFWATLTLGSLWESLKNPASWRWPLTLGLGVICMILTKELSAFVCFFIVTLIPFAKVLGLGQTGRPLFYAAFTSIILGGMGLILLAGGFESFFTLYILSMEMVKNVPFVKYTTDGPWYRYFIDYMAISPIVLTLAIGFMFQGLNKRKENLFLFLFILTTYAALAVVYKNLRYTIMWDFPLRYFALGQVILLARNFGCRTTIATFILVFGLTCFDLQQFSLIFLTKQVYEPVSINLFHALDMIKYK